MFKRSSNSHKKNQHHKKTSFEKLQHKIEHKIEDLGHEIHHDVEVAVKKIKKKISVFYKVSFLVLITLSMVLAYFVILVSTTPKSFPFITKEIRQQLKKNYGDNVTIEETFISFTKYGTLKISAKNLKFFLENAAVEVGAKQDGKEFLLPEVEAEFSLLNVLYSSFDPRKIKIIDPQISIDDFPNTKNSSNQNSLDVSDQIKALIALIAKLKSEESLTRIFEIENAHLIINYDNGNHDNGGNCDNGNCGNSRKEIIIKKSQIRTSSKNNILYISSLNNLNFFEAKTDVNLNSSCQLSAQNNLKCDLSLVNFVTNSIADLSPKLKLLEQIDAILNLTVSFAIDDGKFHNVSFKTEAKNGNFFLPEFFAKKIFFSDFFIKGDYDDNLGILNLSETKLDFKLHDDADISDPNSLNLKSNFNMSLLISDLKNWQNNRLDFYIKIQNAPINELEKLWPVFLQEAEIRKWVIDHISQGLIKDAYAKFSLVKNGSKTTLKTINSQVVFVGADLKYDANFPQISKINGIAKFSENDMNIAISSGEVLGSKIYDATVRIDDFSASPTMLKIFGRSFGDASDGLKHANNSAEFYSNVEKYLNGNSQNIFDIRIPLEKDLPLKNAFIAVKSQINNLNNDYLKGSINVAVKKDFGSENFNTIIDLNSARLDIKELNIDKKAESLGSLNFIIDFTKPKKIEFKNILLSKKETVLVKNKTQIINAKISGNIVFETAPFLVAELNLKNENFGRSGYSLSYFSDNKDSSQKISLRGQVFDLYPLIKNKLFKFSSEKKFNNSNIQIVLDNLLLANSKSIKNFYVNLKCANQLCYSGLIKGNYNKKQQSINIKLSKKLSEDFSVINGQISDVGYLAEAFDISNIIAGGDAKLNLQSRIINKKPVLAGEITINDNVIIYENPSVKRLASNDLFSKIRDKIFSNDKTIFDSLKLDFAWQNNIINIKSLIANNYKIGITAKGFIDLGNDTYEIKGMIVPGFIINNLFGIGNIPILGNMISGLLTGGEGGGVFGIRYEYVKLKNQQPNFTTSKISSFVPTTIKNLFDLI
ncbi:MAG: DUF3971 domain-containing protein [Rickettsiales bacterium]|nr:DUF3971 domain-containing protein [Rickettsiales bacterium]